jgi:curli biogenesis system outer membrane secretion channel CsgG
MKNFVTVLFSIVLTFPLYAGSNKAVVFVDKFIPNEGCKITNGDLQILHDCIIGNVVSSRKYEVVERENLAKVQKELKLVDAGLTEGDAPESNKLKAAGYCIYGKILQYRNNKAQADVGGLTVQSVKGIIELQLRITNIENGRILGAKTIKQVGSKNLSNAVSTTKNLEQEVMTETMSKAAKEVVVALNDIAFPVYVLSANRRFVTGNITAEQVVEGEVWEVFELGDELKDPQTGEVLGQDEELIAKVRVSRPGPKTTKFEYVSDEDKKVVLESKEDGVKMLLRRAPERMRNSGSAAPKRSLKDALGGY